jgi:solute carrier family 45 protein 1/2/4
LSLDVVPGEQLANASAWQGRFAHVGNILGYAVGSLNLANAPVLKYVGGGQFRKGRLSCLKYLTSCLLILTLIACLVCIIAIIALVTTVWATCWFTEEEEKEEQLGQKKGLVFMLEAFIEPLVLTYTTCRKFSDVWHTIYEAVIHLPKPVRRVCYVQICAFMGWFPYLFYSTTWVAEVMATEIGKDPNVDDATRAGVLALLIYSFGESNEGRRSWPS